MKERLLQLLDLEQITPSKFADIIGVQRSSVSHVISGRNKPSYDFLHKTLKAFPGLNASWLMMGEGTMYEQMGRKVPGNLFDTPEMQPEVPDPVENPEGDPESSQILDSKRPSEPAQVEPIAPESTTKAETTEATTQSEERPAEESREARKIVQLLVIYDDDTFRTFAPAH
jgi:transcriptional regulator with XRE-family HTH domain